MYSGEFRVELFPVERIGGSLEELLLIISAMVGGMAYFMKKLQCIPVKCIGLVRTYIKDKLVTI